METVIPGWQLIMEYILHYLTLFQMPHYDNAYLGLEALNPSTSSDFPAIFRAFTKIDVTKWSF